MGLSRLNPQETADVPSVRLLSPSFAIRLSCSDLFLTQRRRPRVPRERAPSTGAGRTAGT